MKIISELKKEQKNINNSIKRKSKKDNIKEFRTKINKIVDIKKYITKESINKFFIIKKKKYANNIKYFQFNFSILNILVILLLFSLSKNSKIIINIPEKGNQNILSENFESSPDKIIINNNIVDSNITSYNFPNENNIVELIWNNPINNCSFMFENCKGISKIDVSNFDSSKVEDMTKMFHQCYKLESLNLTNFNTSSCKNMYGMFWGCKIIKSIDVSSFDTSKVENMVAMFNYCEKLESINVTNFDTSSVTSMLWMFMSCLKLTSIDISNFNTLSVNNIGFMFRLCESLKSIDISNFNTSNVSYV